MWSLSLLVFLDKGLKFQPNVGSGCYDVLMIFMNLSNIVIVVVLLTR